MTALIRSGLLLAGLEGLHALDHMLIQDRELPLRVASLGVIEGASLAFVLLLAFRGSPRAPLAAVVVGAGTAAIFVAVHVLPHWSALSDPYADASLGVVSWAIMFVGVAGSLAFAAAGLAQTRRGAPNAV